MSPVFVFMLHSPTSGLTYHTPPLPWIHIHFSLGQSTQWTLAWSDAYFGQDTQEAANNRLIVKHSFFI